jgi:5-methylcytosine-specific restriction endonuclease McrA
MEAKTIQKYKDQTVPNLIKKATKYFNEYIRLRDSDGGFFTCISCGEHKSKEMLNAGHYLSAGHHPSVRFNEYNVNAQCVACNNYKHGNLINYRKNLIKKIGLDRVEFLEGIGKRPHKWDRMDLIEIIETYKQKVKDLKGK